MTHKIFQRNDQRLPRPKVLWSNEGLRQWLVICTHLAILAILYGQTYSFDYVYFDDSEYVLENSAVRAGLTLDGTRWAFTSFYMSNWHPLSWLSHMLDVSLFGIDPGWAHLHNAALHGINSLLVYCILLKLSGNYWKAYVLSLIFLVHPLHVESVAWIAERKDLLCAFFFLLGLIFYDSYRARPSNLRYVGILITYAFALMAKPMAVTFPLTLLILDFFFYRKVFETSKEVRQNHKFNYFKAIAEKLPFLALSAIMGAVTIAAQDSTGSIAYIEAHSISSRWIVATTGYIIYLRQFLIPTDLVALYPISESSSLIINFYPSIILIGLAAIAVFTIPTYPLIAAGLCWYLVTLLPVIGLIQVGSQAHADRYMYLPSIGILLSCIYLVPSVENKFYKLSKVLSVIIIVYLTMISYWQIGYWKNQNILFSRVLDVVGPSYPAHIHLAGYYTRHGMLKEAREHSFKAVDIRPDWPDAYMAIGNIALAELEFKEAEYFYRMARSKGHKTAKLMNNIGITMAEQGDAAGGIKAFQAALEIKPDLIEAQKNLAHYKLVLSKDATQ
jgi:hypothetical protein